MTWLASGYIMRLLIQLKAYHHRSQENGNSCPGGDKLSLIDTTRTELLIDSAETPERLGSCKILVPVTQ